MNITNLSKWFELWILKTLFPQADRDFARMVAETRDRTLKMRIAVLEAQSAGREGADIEMANATLAEFEKGVSR